MAPTICRCCSPPDWASPTTASRCCASRCGRRSIIPTFEPFSSSRVISPRSSSPPAEASMKNAIGAMFIVLVTACAQADSAGTSPAPDPGGGSAAADDRCTTDYVEVTNGNPACGMALEEDGSLTVGEQKTPPIVVSRQEGADGKTDITAKKLVLFPPSTLHGYRIVQACEDTIETSLCWAVRLLTVDGTLLAVSAGKYGPERWIRWSPE